MRDYPIQDYFKHLLIHTPFEEPAHKLRELLVSGRRRKYPELKEIHRESLRFEQAMQRVIGQSSNCIDIGCHLGSVLSKIVQLAPHGHHIAFEPIPYKATWLKQKFPEVDIKEVALSNIAGDASYFVNTRRSGFYSGLRPYKANEYVREITVKREKLDDILSLNYRVDFIKIDVDGGELDVLKGAVKTLRNYCPPIIFECAQPGLSNFGLTSAQIFDFLTKEQSYAVYLFKDFLEDGKPLNLERFNHSLQYPFQAFNFIAVKR